MNKLYTVFADNEKAAGKQGTFMSHYECIWIDFVN